MNAIPPLYKPAAPAAPSSSAIPPHVSTLQSAPTETEPANKPIVTAEGVMQRLRYFETLAGQYEHYILTLQAALKRTGHAVPTAYFAALTEPGGSYVPKVS